MHRIEIVGRLGEQLDALLRGRDDLLGGHADVKFIQDIAPGRMLLNQFDHRRALAGVRRNGEPHHASSSAA
jgi:hypothetical protein